MSLRCDNLTIDNITTGTDALTTLTRITGDLTIGGSITDHPFPNFAALEVVEGNLTISGLSDASLAALTGNLVPV